VDLFQLSKIINKKAEPAIISHTIKKAIKFWTLQTRIMDRCRITNKI
jgi:uncharacterized membrane protein YwzB